MAIATHTALRIRTVAIALATCGMELKLSPIHLWNDTAANDALIGIVGRSIKVLLYYFVHTDLATCDMELKLSPIHL